MSTDYPFTATGGFASVLVAPRSGPVVLRTFTVGGHHQHQVSTSGAFLADDYQPGSSRMIIAGTEPGPAGAVTVQQWSTASFVSTPSGADLVVVLTEGGPIQRWNVTPADYFVPADPYPASGTNVAAM